MPEERLLLDMDRFQALSSETRVRILKSLDRRQMTLSELSVSLGLARSTLHEHLAHLVDTGFVASRNDGHRWVYYALTPDGVTLLHQNEKTRVSIILTSAIIALFAGAFVYLCYLYSHSYQNDLLSYQDGVQGGCPLFIGALSLLIMLVLIYMALRYFQTIKESVF